MKEIEEMLLRQRRYFATGATLPASFRLRQLRNLKEALQNREQELLDALAADLGKPPFEGYATELGMIHEEISFAEKHLKRWMRPRRVPTPIRMG